MPIRLLSLPVKDLQYALDCMDLGDLIAFSLCSKQTKNLVKSMNRTIDRPFVVVYDNCIRFNLTGLFNNVREFISLEIFDSCIKLDGIKRTAVWRRQEFAQGDWIAHLLSIFNESMIDELVIRNVSISYLDTVKQLIPKCQKLRISPLCSSDVGRISLLKLAPISEEVEVEKNIFDDKNDISKFLTPNLKRASFHDPEHPFKLTSEDLLVFNIANLSIGTASITGKGLNRFLKLWMKSNHRFYRPKLIELFLRKDCVEVLKGIKCEAVKDDYCKFQLKRKDGKELLVLVAGRSIHFEFV